MSAPHLITPLDWSIEALARAAADGADLREAAAAQVESNRFRACAERIADLETRAAAAAAEMTAWTERDAERNRRERAQREMALCAIAEADDLRAKVERLRALLCEIDRQLGHDDRDDAIREQITEAISREHDS
jgi:hypothetical protein